MHSHSSPPPPRPPPPTPPPLPNFSTADALPRKQVGLRLYLGNTRGLTRRPLVLADAEGLNPKPSTLHPPPYTFTSYP